MYELIKKTKTFFKLFRNKKIDRIRLINLIKVQASIYFKSPRIFGYPYILIIEPTNICNLKCPTCPTGNGSLKRKKEMMSFETFKKTIDEVGKYLINIVVMNFGEPMMNKDFYKMVEYATSKNIHVTTCTNGHFIDAKKIIESKIDELTVSLDGINQKTLNEFRKGSNFNQVIKGIAAVTEEKRIQKTNKPFLNLQFIIMKHNENQIKEFKELANKLGANQVTFKALWVSSEEEARKYLPSNQQFHRYILKENGYALKNIESYQCKKPWTDIAINCDGSLVLCACDYDNNVILGNINNQRIKDIINNEKAKKIRKLLLKNRSQIPICTNCAPNSNISITEKTNN